MQDAHKFCKAWFKSALDENLLIWRARNLEKHGDDLSDYKPWFNLRQRSGEIFRKSWY